mgnify:CR=1 FL=1
MKFAEAIAKMKLQDAPSAPLNNNDVMANIPITPIWTLVIKQMSSFFAAVAREKRKWMCTKTRLNYNHFFLIMIGGWLKTMHNCGYCSLQGYITEMRVDNGQTAKTITQPYSTGQLKELTHHRHIYLITCLSHYVLLAVPFNLNWHNTHCWASMILCYVFQTNGSSHV